MDSRKNQTQQYLKWLTREDVQTISVTEDSEFNCAYFPIVFKTSAIADKIFETLNANNVTPRRYFNPSLNLTEPYRNGQVCPVSEDICSRVLCLPVYYNLSNEEIDFICRIVLRTLNN